MNTATLFHIWQVIVESNIFNFVIFVLCFALIFKKINLKGIITALHKKIVDTVETAKITRETAHKELSLVEDSVANLGSEIEVIIKEAEKSAAVISNKIKDEAKKQLENIDANAAKVIDAEEKLLVANLTKNTSKASVQIAKVNIVNALEQAPDMHEKYINESIDELDKKLDRLIF